MELCGVRVLSALFWLYQRGWVRMVKQRFEETDPLQTAPGMHEDQLTRDSGLRGQPPLMLLDFLLGLLDLLLGLIELLLQQRALVQRVARRVDADPGRRRPASEHLIKQLSRQQVANHAPTRLELARHD